MRAGDEFERLVGIMRTLRSPEGCPWDREQTLQSLTHFVLEEAYEVVDAIERGDRDALKEEIGDHVFEGVFLAQVAADDKLFTIAEAPSACLSGQRPGARCRFERAGTVGRRRAAAMELAESDGAR